MSSSTTDLHETAELIQAASRDLTAIEEQVGQFVVGQTQLRRRLACALITDGHVLLEGVPGLAKTMAIKALADALDGSFKRIQFTPDLLPADLIGTEVYRPAEGTFEIRKGPVFANFVLADEINRAPAKVQSALLETMQEKQVTVGDRTFEVPQPFFVMATQNPIEQEGTYPLPEAQVDRFMFKLKIDYPSSVEEIRIIERVLDPKFRQPLSSGTGRSLTRLSRILEIREVCQRVYVDDRIKQYIVNLVTATRNPPEFGLKLKPLIELGASPRGSLSLFLAARAEALLNGESYVVPQNVKDVAADILRHRIMPSYEAQAQGLDSDKLIQTILEHVQVP